MHTLNTLLRRVAALEPPAANAPALVVLAMAITPAGLMAQLNGTRLLQQKDEDQQAFIDRAQRGLRQWPGQTLVLIEPGDVAL